MSHITILLKPRPTHKMHGTNWIPCGNAYGPFHPAHSPPADATDAHEITISNILIAQWAEFHTIIHPLLVLPPALDSAPMRTLYAGWHAHHAPRLDRLGSFFALLYARIVELHTAAGLHAGGLRVARLSARLFATDLSPLNESILELKITVNMLQETVDSMLSATKYKADLDKRCSIWDKACGRGSFCVLLPLSFLWRSQTPSSH
ncbi:hypothetical protein B0H11DRAFT_1985587 [Mycena galericulata]|nr:hypothetical protein B0H11DRAFT_1985587 [Mycena galericulata]